MCSCDSSCTFEVATDWLSAFRAMMPTAARVDTFTARPEYDVTWKSLKSSCETEQE